jgi:hypothetical protein
MNSTEKYIYIFYIRILSQFVKPPSDTLLRYNPIGFVPVQNHSLPRTPTFEPYYPQDCSR